MSRRIHFNGTDRRTWTIWNNTQKWAPAHKHKESLPLDILEASALKWPVSILSVGRRKAAKRDFRIFPSSLFPRFCEFLRPSPRGRNSHHIKPPDNAGSMAGVKDSGLGSRRDGVEWGWDQKAGRTAWGKSRGGAGSALCTYTGFYWTSFSSAAFFSKPFPGNVQIISKINTNHFASLSIGCDEQKEALESRGTQELEPGLRRGPEGARWDAFGLRP